MPRISYLSVYSQSFLCVCILSVFKHNSGMDNNYNGSAYIVVKVTPIVTSESNLSEGQ